MSANLVPFTQHFAKKMYQVKEFGS